MPVGGRDYLRLMTDQSRRAHDFRRQLRWFRMRGQLAEQAAPPVVKPSAEPPAPAPPV
jgi:hypothetical protein